MKEFEKWSKTPNGYAERESDHAEAEAAWKAALEWALSKSFVDAFDYLHAYEDKEKNHKVISVDVIEEELNS